MRSNRTILTCDAKLAVRKDAKNVILVKGKKGGFGGGVVFLLS
jgi:hypothetical protein